MASVTLAGLLLSTAERLYEQAMSQPEHGSAQPLLCATIAALRATVVEGDASFVGSGRLSLRARCMLAQVVLEHFPTDRHLLYEAHQVLSQALAAASKHASFMPFRYRILALQVKQMELAASPASSNAKAIKAHVKRVLAELAGVSHTFPEWHYHFLLLSASSSTASYAESLAALRQVQELAQQRGDGEMHVFSQVLAARLALSHGQVDMVTSIIAQLDAMDDAAAIMGQQTGPQGRQRKIWQTVVSCCLLASKGDTKDAKERLKKAHLLLDEALVEAGETEGWCAIPITPGAKPLSASQGPTDPATTEPTLVVFATPPRALVYTFAFLVSVAVHRDPYGGRPRSKLFASEGIKVIDQKLAALVNTRSIKAGMTPSQLHGLKIMLLIFSAELDIMRSSFSTAHDALLDAVQIASGEELWDRFKLRIVLAWAALHQAQNKTREAVMAYSAVVGAAGAAGENEQDGDTIILAKAGLVTCRISQSTPGGLGALSASQSVDPYIANLARDVTSATETREAPMKLLGQIVGAVTAREITRSKAHLGQALTIANETIANHAKAIVLSLLANVYLHTRNDQAIKMLSAAYTICRGMSPQPPKLKGTVNAVGNAQLGLWVGERLLEIYQRDEPEKVAAQHASNEAHRRVLATYPPPQ